MLPNSFTNMPIFFKEEEFKLLKGSPFLDQIRDKL